MASIKRTITLKTDTDTAYDYVSNPVQMTQWFCDEAETTDKGFAVKWKMEGGAFGFDAVIIEDDTGKSFAYRTVEDDPTVTRFSITATDDSSELTVVEGDFPDTDAGRASMQEHASGWDFFLRRLQGIFT